MKRKGKTMSNTIRSQFEGIKDVNFHQTKKVANFVTNQLIDIREDAGAINITEQEVDEAFQVILDESYFASEDYMQVFSNVYSYDPRKDIKV